MIPDDGAAADGGDTSRSLAFDDRGQAVWVGFVLLLTLLLLVLAGYQAYSVPQQNAETEFQHSQEIQGDMEELSNALLDIRATREGTVVSEHRAVRLQLGTDYRTRVLTINPPPAVGTLNARDRGPVDISGATTVGAFRGNPEQTLLESSHDTRLLVYQPGYNEYAGAPTTRFEHSLLFNRFDTADRTLRGQRTIRGGTNRLNVVLYEGDVSRSQLRTTLDPETLDGPTAPVPIEAASGDTFDLTLPTDAPDLWASPDVIGETFDEGEPDARVVATGDTTVTVELRGQWDLQMTRVGFDGGQRSDAFSSIEPVTLPTGAPANRTYDIRWDRAAIAATAGTEYDAATDTLLIDSGLDTVEGLVTVRERATAQPVDGATVDPATTERTVVDVADAPGRTDDEGRTTVELTVGDEGTARLFAASGDDVDAVDVSVLEPDVSGSAGRVSYEPGSLELVGNGNGFLIRLEIEEPVELTAASIDTSTMPDGIRQDLNTVRIDGTNRKTGSYDTDGSTIPLDPVTVDGSVPIEFRTFSEDGQARLPGDPSDYTLTTSEPGGAYVAVGLQFGDGTVRTLYFDYEP